MNKSIRESRLPCQGVNLFIADGEVAGQQIFHVHLHVLPRTQGDRFGVKFVESYHTKPPRAELESAAREIRKALK